MSDRKPSAIIVDLDGTLCNIGERDPYSGHLCETDTPIAAMVSIAEALYYSNGTEIIFLTGRNETARVATEYWIGKHTAFGLVRSEDGELFSNYDLIMRDPSDWSKAVDYKRWAYMDQIEPQYDVLCVFEDHISVARMFRQEFGLTVFTVAEEDY